MPATPKIPEIQFKAGDNLPGDPNYVILDKDGPGKAGAGGIARFINRGGAGVVYRATYKKMERAIKFLSPRDVEAHPELLDQFRRTFEKEILFLTRVTHTNLAKITDYGEANIAGGTYQYYAMEYIAGKQLDQVWDECTAEAFLKLWDDVLSALAYLHSYGIMHMDVKEANVLVRDVGGVSAATLVDLGVSKVCHLLRDGLFKEPEVSPETYFFSTKKIMRPERVQYNQQKVTLQQLVEWFPDHDLYACGKLLERATSSQRLQGVLAAGLGASAISAISRIRDRLLGPPEHQYTSAQAVRADFHKVSPGYLSPLGLPELSVAANVRTYITMPHGRAAITERVYAIVNNPLFQRLRDIPQLDFAYLLYPGAKHNRMLHSLCCFNLAKEYVGHLLDDPRFRLMVDPVDIEAVLLWALLHDVGQYPLSHMFEDFAADERRAGRQPTILTDEDLFWAFLDPTKADAPVPAFAQVIVTESKRLHGGRVGQLYDIVGRQFSPGVLNSLHAAQAGTEGKYKVLHGIMSSPIDADKVAYLVTDSEHTGVAYGSGIDVDALLTSLTTPTDTDLAQSDGPVIAIMDKGLSAAESVVLARYWMLRRVYWHHTNRALMAMAKFVIGSLLQTDQLNFEEYFRDTLFGTQIDALQYLSTSFRQGERRISELYGHAVGNPLGGIEKGGRGIYKRLLSIAHGPDQEEKQVYEALAFKRCDELGAIVSAVLNDLKKSGLPGTAELRQSDVLLDVPVKRRENLGAKVIVYLQKEPTRRRDLYGGDVPVSPILQGLANEFDEQVKKCRFFVAPLIFQEMVPRIENVRMVVKKTLATLAKTG